MHALSLWQPFASAVVYGLKPIENRTWRPPAALVGERFLIHASKRWDRKRAPGVERTWRRQAWGPEVVPPDEYPLGALIGSVRLIGVIEAEEFPSDRRVEAVMWAPGEARRLELLCDVISHGCGGGDSWPQMATDWWIGPVGWVLADAERFAQPVPCRGRQKLFRPDVEVPRLRLVLGLRGIDRWGVGTRKQAFAGYRALPAPGSDWRAVLGFSGTPTVEQVKERHRALMLEHHPDRGGSHVQATRLNEAIAAAKAELG